MHLIKDSQGRKSWLITLAIPALIAATAWFLCDGIDLTLPGGYRVVTATKSGSDFMMFARGYQRLLGEIT
jgi:hypothetical protein